MKEEDEEEEEEKEEEEKRDGCRPRGNRPRPRNLTNFKQTCLKGGLPRWLCSFGW